MRWLDDFLDYFSPNGFDAVDRVTGKGRYADEYNPGRPEDEPPAWAFAAVGAVLVAVVGALVLLATSVAGG